MKSSSESNPPPDGAVRVTFTIPTRAADLLKQLADGGNQGLKELGVFSVEINGATGLTLTRQTNQTTNMALPRQLCSPRQLSSGQESRTPIVTGESFFDSAIKLYPMHPRFNTIETTRENIRQYLNRQTTTEDESSLRRLMFDRPLSSGDQRTSPIYDRQLPSSYEHRFPFQQQHSEFGRRMQRPMIDRTVFWRAPPSPSRSYRPRKQNPHHVAVCSDVPVDGLINSVGVTGPSSPMYARSPPFSCNPCSPRKMRGGLQLNSPLSHSLMMDPNVDDELTWRQASSHPFLMSLFHQNNNRISPPSFVKANSDQQSVGPFDAVLASPQAGVKKRNQRNQKESTTLQYNVPAIDRLYSTSAADANVPNFNRDMTTPEQSYDDAVRSSIIAEQNSSSPSHSVVFDEGKNQTRQNNFSPRASSESNKLHHLPISSDVSWSSRGSQGQTRNTMSYQNLEFDAKPCSAEKTFISANEQISGVTTHCGSYNNLHNGFFSSSRTGVVWSPNNDSEIKRLLNDVSDEQTWIAKKNINCFKEEDDNCRGEDLIDPNNFLPQRNKSNRISVKTKRRGGKRRGTTTTTSTSNAKHWSVGFVANDNFELNVTGENLREKSVFMNSRVDGNDWIFPNARNVVMSTCSDQSLSSTMQRMAKRNNVSWPTKSDEPYLESSAVNSTDSHMLDIRHSVTGTGSTQITNASLVEHEDVRSCCPTSIARIAMHTDEISDEDKMPNTLCSRQKVNDSSSIMSALLRSNLRPPPHLPPLPLSEEFFSDSDQSMRLNDMNTVRLRHLNRNKDETRTEITDESKPFRIIIKDDSSRKDEESVHVVATEDKNASNRDDEVNDDIKSDCFTVESSKVVDNSMICRSRSETSAFIAGIFSGSNKDVEFTNMNRNSSEKDFPDDPVSSSTTTRIGNNEVIRSEKSSDDVSNDLLTTVVKDSDHRITMTTITDGSKLVCKERDDILAEDRRMKIVRSSDNLMMRTINKTIDVKCFDVDLRPNGMLLSDPYTSVFCTVSDTCVPAYSSFSSSGVTISKATIVCDERTVEMRTSIANESNSHEPCVSSHDLNPDSIHVSTSTNRSQENIAVEEEEEEEEVKSFNQIISVRKNDDVVLDEKRSMEVLPSRDGTTVEDVRNLTPDSIVVSKTAADSSSEIVSMHDKHSCVQQNPFLFTVSSSSSIEGENPTSVDKDVLSATLFEYVSDANAVSGRPLAKKMRFSENN